MELFNDSVLDTDILNDIMGVVASRHLLLADQNIEGTFSAACLQLAALHSDAVDFPKTGTPVNFRELPKANGSLKPDFMVRDHASILVQRLTGSQINNSVRNTKRNERE